MSYSLMDSGEGEKLEVIGEKILRRQSSLAVWKKKLPVDAWNKADASYDPKKGWSFLRAKFEVWEADFHHFKLKLRLQKNGQIGFFPEHLSYLKDLVVNTEGGRTVNVLNLFAYTGAATIFLALRGANVCHVDMSKPTFGWTKENAELNAVHNENIVGNELPLIVRINNVENLHNMLILLSKCRHKQVRCDDQEGHSDGHHI